MKSAIAAVLVLCTACSTASHATTMPPSPVAPDSVAIAAAAAAFHEALAAADAAAAMALLADDAVVMEGGALESRAEYEAHHLAADIEFARVMANERVVRGVRQEGDVAWLWATTACRGTWHGREVDAAGAELLTLSRRDGAWRLRAIHWSSQR